VANLVSLTVDVNTGKVVKATGDFNRLGEAASKSGRQLDRYQRGARQATQETDRMSTAMNKLPNRWHSFLLLLVHLQ